MKSCRMSEQPEFLELPERAQSMYQWCNGVTGRDGIVTDPKRQRQRAGAGDEDVRLLLRRGYLLPLPGGRAFVVRCPYMRAWIEEYVEQHGHAPTMEEIEQQTCGQ